MARATPKTRARRPGKNAGGERTPRASRRTKAEAEPQRAGREGIWSGTISFGLVAIPVRLVAAARSHRRPFRLLHEKDNAPLKRRLRLPGEERFIEPDEITLGYEIEPDRCILMTREEIESVAPERSRTIELTSFVDPEEVDPIYYDDPYYLVPTSALKPYGLLVEALARGRRIGIGRFVLHTREYLVAVRSVGGALCAQLMRFQEEIRPIDDVPVSAEAQVKQAAAIRERVERLGGRFDPRRFDDPYQKRVDALIRRIEKKEGTVEVVEEGDESADAPADPEGLMEALERSFSRAKSADGSKSLRGRGGAKGANGARSSRGRIDAKGAAAKGR